MAADSALVDTLCLMRKPPPRTPKCVHRSQPLPVGWFTRCHSPARSAAGNVLQRHPHPLPHPRLCHLPPPLLWGCFPHSPPTCMGPHLAPHCTLFLPHIPPECIHTALIMQCILFTGLMAISPLLSSVH